MSEARTFLPGDFQDIKLDHLIRQRLKFQFLPDFARFLLENKLGELTAMQLDLFREFQPPIFKYFNSRPDSELLKLGSLGLEKLLTAMANHQSAEYIENSLRDWLNNQLPQISRNQIEAEDVTMISMIRRRFFRKFISDYCSELETAIQVLNEIDDFTTISETTSLKFLLRLQQNIYEQNQKLAKIGNWVWDLKTNTFSWSRELYNIYEIENADINEINLASFNHPDDKELVRNHMEVSRKNKTAHDFFYRIILPGGKEKTLHAKGEVLTDSNGEPEVMFGTLQDFTIQRLNQKELEDNQFFIQKITDLTPSLISVYNIQTGEYLFINQAIETLLGYPKDLVLKDGLRFFLKIMHPDDLNRVQVENARALETANNENPQKNEQIIEFRYRLKHSNGEYRWFNTYGSVFERDKSGNVEKVINVSIDVSDQLKTSSLLKERDLELVYQEERYFRMINEVEDYAILRLSPEGIIENWNAGAEKIKGYKAAEIIGKHFRIFYSPEDQESKLPDTLIQKAFSEGKALHEGWRVRKDGSRFWGSILITALHDPLNNVVGFSKVTRDLTQMKMAEDNLIEHSERIEKANSELEQKNKQLESFNYIASHDLKEPLRKIKLFISKLREDGHVSFKTSETISKIENASTRMQDLIEGLLLYCQADNIDFSKSTSLESLLEDVISDFSEQIELKEIEISMAPLPFLKVNDTQLRQVFFNIISNAVKYKKEDIPLKLKITYSIEFRVNPGGNKKSDFHKISFQDNGIGFEPNYADKIFGLFQRLHDQSKYSGTGLGLAICKKIMENHGGDITAQGIPLQGAEFSIFLPVVSDKLVSIG
jgi:PAS domain S-box-containing protein